MPQMHRLLPMGGEGVVVADPAGKQASSPPTGCLQPLYSVASPIEPYRACNCKAVGLLQGDLQEGTFLAKQPANQGGDAVPPGAPGAPLRAPG